MKMKTKQMLREHASAAHSEGLKVFGLAAALAVTGMGVASLPRNYSDSGVVSGISVNAPSAESFAPYAQITISGGEEILDRTYNASEKETKNLYEGMKVDICGKRSPMWGIYTTNYSSSQ